MIPLRSVRPSSRRGERCSRPRPAGFFRGAAAFDGRIEQRPVTNQPLARLTIKPVRRASITSVLLIVVLATSVSYCMTGWGSQLPASCSRSGCASKKPAGSTAAERACGHVLKPPPGPCVMRSFIQFQVVAFRTLGISPPLRPAVAKVLPPSDPTIIVSSIGSPETDRGPPRS